VLYCLSKVNKEMSMQTEAQNKTWSNPELTVYGSVETLTLQAKNKRQGVSDGFTFNGLPISG
jgi:hypothetical protein